MSRIPPWLVVLIFGCSLLLPMLGSFGLWDPIEIQHADVAQEVAKSGSFRDVTVGGKFSPRPVLYVWLVALGFKTLGVSELSGRIPLALCGVLCLLLAFRTGKKLVSTRAGLISAFVLATTPAFLFQSRQMVSEVPFYLSLIATIGGLAAFLWPADGKHSRFDLCLGGFGLVLGFLARGLVLGVIFPLASLVLALALSWKVPHRQGMATELDPEPNSESSLPIASAETLTVGQVLSQTRTSLIWVLGAAVVMITFFLICFHGVGQSSYFSYLILGGEYRRQEFPPAFDTLFKSIGFGFFPWFAFLPLALVTFVREQRRVAETRSHLAFPYVLILVVITAAYVLGTFWIAYFGNIRYPGLPWLAIGMGLFIHQLLLAPTNIPRFWGLVALSLILVLQQDYFFDPQSLAFCHLTDSAKYPIELSIKEEVRGFGILLALFVFLGLGGTPEEPIQIGSHLSWKWLRTISDGLARLLNRLSSLIRVIGGEDGRRYFWAGGGVTLAFTGWCAFVLMPNLSLHLSNKGLFETYHSCRNADEKLAQYQVVGRGAAYYNKGQVEEVRDQEQLFQHLREPKRWFVLVPTNQLANLDQAARQAKIPYYVLDDRSSQFLIISNQLSGACNRDRNPLRRYVLDQPPKVPKVQTANFENKVKLLGYDVPEVVSRGGKFAITLYFQVLDRVPAGYKLFIHFDQPAARFHGDHEPLDGKFPTQYWLPGEYIVDVHEVEIPYITTSAGSYTIYMGFWLGEERLKVIEGSNDGANRVQLGTLRVK